MNHNGSLSYLSFGNTKSILFLLHMKKNLLKKTPTLLNHASSTSISYAIYDFSYSQSARNLPHTFMLSFEIQLELFHLERVVTNGVNLNKNK